MIERIVILGDSNTYGHGCSDRMYYYDNQTEQFVGNFFTVHTHPASDYCWASLLQHQYPDIKVHNLSSPGRSNTGMFKDLYDFYKHTTPNSSDLILLCTAPSDRIEISTTNNCHDADPSLPSVADTCSLSFNSISYATQTNIDPRWLAKKQYFAHLHNRTVGELHAVTAILACQGWALCNGVQFKFSLNRSSQMITDMCSNMAGDIFSHIHNYNFTQSVHQVASSLYQADQSPYISEDRYHANNHGQLVYYNRVILPLISSLV